jgi:HlyD family secretion protein
MITERRRRQRFGPIVALFAALATVGARHAGASDGTGAAAGTGATDAVSALGRIEPEDGIIRVGMPSTPQAISGSIVRRLLVKAGDDVTAGQILAESDSVALQKAEVELATAELELAERESAKATGEEQDVCSRADVAQRTSVRRANLLKSGVASHEEAEVAAGDAKSLSGSCAAAGFATKAAAAGVDVGRARLRKAEAALERAYIRAPIDGRVLEIHADPGELIGPSGVLEMGKVQRMYAIAEVWETDIGRVREGQKATVTSRALGKALTGVVKHVRLMVRKQDATGTDPAARKDARIVEVEVLLDDPGAVAALSNLQVEVLIHP